VMSQVEKSLLLRTLDRLWRDHIITIDQLRQVIYLRSYGQRDPLNEYKTEAFNLFQALVTGLKEQVTSQLMRVEIEFQQPGDDMLPSEDELPDMEIHHIDATTGEDDVEQGIPLLSPAPAKRAAKAKAPKLDPKNPETWGKIGRNDQCPCGSGKRFKHCHGAYV
jgi:preprotein translocase subunit SecA